MSLSKKEAGMGLVAGGLLPGDLTPETMERVAGRNEGSVKADLCAQNFPFKLQHQSWI